MLGDKTSEAIREAIHAAKLAGESLSDIEEYVSDVIADLVFEESI